MASIQGIYIALFGRPADPAGLAFFNEVTNNGQDLSAIGDLTSTEEYQTRFDGKSNEDVINSIFQDLFGREADPVGLKFFSDGLADGTFTINTIAIAILDGAQGTDRDVVAAKIKAADLFTAALDTPDKVAAYVGDDAAANGRTFLVDVISEETIPTAEEIDNAISTIGDAPSEGEAPANDTGGGDTGGDTGGGETPVPSGVPIVVGDPIEDNTLRADTSGITDPEGLGTFFFVWLRDGEEIPQEDSEITYRLGDDDVGKKISVRVSYTDGEGNPEVVTSPETAPVENINDAPVALNDAALSAHEFLVNQETNGFSAFSHVVSLEDGGFVFVWFFSGRDEEGNLQEDIKAIIHNADGSIRTDEFVVSQLTEGRQASSSIIALPNGGFVVSWTSNSTDVKTRIFDKDGAPVTDEFTTSAFTQDTQDNVKMLALTDGEFMAVWQSRDLQQGGSREEIKARIFNSDGTVKVDEFVVNEIKDKSQIEPDIIGLADGRVLVTWRTQADEYLKDGDLSQIAGRILDLSNPENNSDEFLINEFSEGVQFNPVVEALPNGGFVVVWPSFKAQQGDEDTGIKARIFDSNGVAEENTEFLVNQITDSTQLRPNVAVLEDGNFVIVWDSLGVDGNSSGVSLRIFNPDGSAKTDELPVNEFIDGSQDLADVTAVAGGGFLVTWRSDDGFPADTDTLQIKARFFDADGNPQATETILENSKTTLDISDLLFNDSDVEGDLLTITQVDTQSANGATVEFNLGEGTIVYDPTEAADIIQLNAGESLRDTFTYTVSDGNGGSDTATVTVVVLGVGGEVASEALA